MRSQVWQRRALTGIKGQTSGSSSTIWATTNKLFPFAINDASPNNSSLMLNNFTTSIFYRYVWAISRGGKMMSWVSLCSPLDCRKCWSKLLPAIIEHRTLVFGLQTFWKVTNGSDQSCRWIVYCMVQLLKKLYFYQSVNCGSKLRPRHTLDPSTGENAGQISQENMKNQSGKSDSGLARNLPPLLKFGRRILDFLSSLIGCFVPARKRTGRFESGVWMDHNLS